MVSTFVSAFDLASWIIYQIFGTVMLVAVLYLGYKMFQIYHLASTIALARDEFHENLIEISSIYDQKFPTPVRVPSPLIFMDPTQSSSCDTAVSHDSTDLPVELPSESEHGPTRSMALAASQKVWLRYPPILEESVRKALQPDESISEYLKIEETDETHHELPILNVTGLAKLDESYLKKLSSSSSGVSSTRNQMSLQKS